MGERHGQRLKMSPIVFLFKYLDFYLSLEIHFFLDGEHEHKFSEVGDILKIKELCKAEEHETLKSPNSLFNNKMNWCDQRLDERNSRREDLY